MVVSPGARAAKNNAAALIFPLTAPQRHRHYVSVLILRVRSVRITAAAKLATRNRILEAARALFAERGFEAVTTRDIARAAGIASGTLFNYFSTKEAIATALVAAALAEVHARFDAGHRRGGSLEEDLFALVAAELRGLKPHRGYLKPAIESALGPLAKAVDGPEGQSIRGDHLERVERLLASRGRGGPPSFVTLHLYWALYAGVLAFWACDPSPNQEDTLAVLDHSLRAFVGSLPAAEPPGP
jgi:AcrR family transcriptional regulator